MSYVDDFRASSSQYELTSSASNVMYFEILATAVYAFIHFTSWYALVAVFIGLIICIRLPIIGQMILGSYVLLWGYAGYYIGTVFVKGHGTEAGIALSVLGLFLGYNVHSNAWAWLKDLSR